MFKLNIRKIIAKEGLIIIGLAVILSLINTFISQKVPAVFPRYKVEFSDGKTYTIDIYPDYYYSTNTLKTMRDFYHPSSKLIEKRIGEFIKKDNIRATLKESRLINARQLYLSEALFSFLALNLLLKVVLAYAVLVLLRFIIWSLRVVRAKEVAS